VNETYLQELTSSEFGSERENSAAEREGNEAKKDLRSGRLSGMDESNRKVEADKKRGQK
jgi:neutral trehalase